MDLFLIKDIPNQKFNVGMSLIDVFDKFMHLVAIKGKKEEDEASELIECLHKMGKKPKIIYTDDEGAMSKEAIQTYLEDEKIEHRRTRAHPNFSERAIRTFKDQLDRRVEADQKNGKEGIQWTDYIFEMLITYNNQRVHSATGITPKEARKETNAFKVKLIYPEVNKGDEVAIFRKRTPNETEPVGNWSQNIYTAEKS